MWNLPQIYSIKKSNPILENKKMKKVWNKKILVLEKG